MSESHTPTSGSARLNTGVAHNARVWNYWIGGKDNYEVDQQVGDHVASIIPVIRDIARADRDFLGRAVAYLTRERGVRQFLDIGTGLPTADNTHEIAQRIAPDARIVYVDNDPIVLVHARTLLTGTSEGATDYIDADVHDPGAIVERASATLDFSKPVAVMLLGILNFVLDTEKAREIVRRVMAEVPSGSFLVLTHPTFDPEVGGELQVAGDGVLERERHSPDHRPRRRGHHRVLRRTGTGGARSGLLLPVARRTRRRSGGAPVRRGGREALTPESMIKQCLT